LQSFQRAIAFPMQPFESELVAHVNECYPRLVRLALCAVRQQLGDFRVANLLKEYSLDDGGPAKSLDGGSSRLAIGFELWPVTVGFQITIASQVRKLLCAMEALTR